MWTYAVSTLRAAGRSPVVWGLVGLALGAGWLGLRVSVLALGEGRSQAADIVLSTAQALGAVLALWLVASHLEEDRRGGFPAAADQTAPGAGARVLGRWIGAAVVAGVLAMLVHAGLDLLRAESEASLWLYLAIIWPAFSLAAWGTLLGIRGGGGVAVAGGLVLWVLGHLPWGSPALLPGALGRAISAWLPRPASPAEALATGGYTAAAVAGLLLLALAVAPRPGAGD